MKETYEPEDGDAIRGVIYALPISALLWTLGILAAFFISTGGLLP